MALGSDSTSKPFSWAFQEHIYDFFIKIITAKVLVSFLGQSFDLVSTYAHNADVESASAEIVNKDCLLGSSFLGNAIAECRRSRLVDYRQSGRFASCAASWVALRRASVK